MHAQSMLTWKLCLNPLIDNPDALNNRDDVAIYYALHFVETL